MSLKPPCFVVRLPLKNIWFRHRKHRWKYPEFLLRTSCFVATNAAEDGSTSCEKYLISAVNVRSFPKKNMLTNAPPKKGPFCSIVTYKFKMFGLNISLVVKPRSAAESSLSEGVKKKDAFDNPESTSEEIISTLGVKMAAVRSVWTVESTYADSQTPVTQPSHLLGLCDI